MAVEDKIIKWFLEKLIINRIKIIDKPGFLINRIEVKNETSFERDICVPESFLINLENYIADNYGEKGKQILYSAGKRFIMSYCKLAKLPTINTISKEELQKFMKFFIRYLEAGSYGEIHYNLNIDTKIAKIKMMDFIICPHNGRGYMFTWAAPAGILSYILGDTTIEGVQTKCQGLGNDNCEVFVAPRKILDEMKLKYYKESIIEEMKENKDYEYFNAIAKTKYANKSLRKLMKDKFIQYSKGVLERNNERYIMLESIIMYIIEKRFSKIIDDNTIFDISFNVGKRIAEKEKILQNYSKFIIHLMSACGFGDVHIIQKKGKYIVITNHFPWCEGIDEINFSFYRGLMSGMLTSFANRDVKLTSFTADTRRCHLMLTIREK